MSEFDRDRYVDIPKSPKLDLRAVETRHKETMNGSSSNPGAYVNSAADVPALLAHIHALRADGRRLWSAVRVDDRAGLVMAAHNFAAVLAQALDS